MSWKSHAIRCTFSPGAAAESLPTFSKESSPSSPSKSRTSSEQSSASVSPTCHCGTTFAPSAKTTPNAPKPSPNSKPTATTLSLPGASLAKISLVLEKARDYAAREAACSMSTRGSFAKFDPVSYSWRIPLFLFAGELSRYSGKWPRWGMMVRGECYPLPTWEAVINATAFGERSADGIEEPPAAESAPWPTPRANDALDAHISPESLARSHFDAQRLGLTAETYRREGIIPTATQSATGPTPTCAGLDGGSHSRKAAKNRGRYIPNSVSARPTPTANDYKGSGKNGDLRDRLDYAVERGATKSHQYPTPNCGKLAGGSGGTKQLNHLVEIGAQRPDESRAMGHTFPTIGTKTMGGCSGSQHKLEELERIGAQRADERRVLQSGNGGVSSCGYLNPDWIEWLMNWPLGWTDPDAAALLWLLPEDDPADLAPDADGYVPRITSRKEYRINRVETLGNGQFPLTAAAAFIFGRAILAAVLELIKEHTRHAETGTV